MNKKLQNIIFIQQRLKFLLVIKNNFNSKYTIIKNILYKLSNIIVTNYNNEIISQYIYTNNLTKLEELTNKFQKINTNINLKNVLMENLKLTKLICLLIKVSKECGIDNLSNFLLIINENINNKILIDFINNSFNITEIEIKNNYIEKINKTKTKTNLTIYKDNDKNFYLNYDLKNIANLDEFLFSTNLKKNISFLESINGCRIYIRCKNKNTILILNGFFNNDQLNIFRNHNLFEDKINLLDNELCNLNININFKEAYLKQFSLKNFIILDIEEIIEKIKKDYFTIINYKNKSLSVLVKEFLNKDINEQINFISMFLLFEEDPEIQNMSYLLYDMICNESFLLKPSADGNFIFSNIHWSLQKEFKVINKKYSNNIKQLESFTLEEVSYEKRIYLMKSNNGVKQKAYDKLKEISNKSNDNSSKAIQYLDNLLKIPFGIYQKEDILVYYDKFILNYILNIKRFLKNIKFISPKLTYLKELIKKDKIYYDEVILGNKYIKSVINNDISKNLNLKILKESLQKKTKNKLHEILTLLENDNLNKIKTKKPKNKSDYIYKISDILLNCDNNTQEKYMHLVTNEIKNNDMLNSNNNIIKEFNLYNKTVSNYLNSSSKILDDAIYGQDEAKIEIKRIISQWINGDNTGYCLGFEGPPGTGKTTIAKEGISNCLKDSDNKSRPFSFIALGGSTNGSTFEGHNYTYLGSTHGKIVDILIESKCMNPIIYIDELDKISNTENGKELIGILTHLTDSTQNEQFNDKYFSGIDFDLSKVLFIFSYNDYDKLDKILADRIHRIKFNYMSTNEKIIIMKKYLIPKLLKTVGIKDFIVFEDHIIEHIIENYTVEGGVRKLKEKIFEIIRQINLELLNDTNYLEILNEKNIYKNNKLILDKNIVDEILEKKPKVLHKTIGNNSKVGLINGLYATSNGTGGITIIEAYKTFHETKLALVITGRQGDVMKESIQCAKTIAWNLIPENIKNNICDSLKNNSYGIHIHCPEAATPKDGPSAGTAITLTILSLLTNSKIKNNIAVTGEINLNGEVLAVGGIDLKIEGGKKAGVTKILLPIENKDDFKVIKKIKPDIDNGIEIIFIQNIWDTFEHIFTDNKINFNTF
jgi:ATP-dependent Lon protease